MNGRERIRRYLLGNLPPQEQEQLENRCFADDRFFEELAAAESDLIDSYVKGSMPGSERGIFEKRCHESARLMARVKFAGTLRQASLAPRLGDASARTSSAWTALPLPRAFAWAAGAVFVMALGVAWLAKNNYDFRAALQRTEADRTVLSHRVQELEARQTGPSSPSTAWVGNPPAPQPAVLILTLTPGVLRGGEASRHTLAMTAGGSFVQLQLAGAATSAGYEVDLETAEGQRVAHVGQSEIQTTKNHEFVVLRVPADSIHPGDYVVKLSGVDASGRSEEVEVYSFRAVR